MSQGLPGTTSLLTGFGASAPRLTIVRVETIPLRVPFRTVFKFSQGSRPQVEILLVRLHTDGGITGVGETQAWRRQGSSETLPNLVRTIADHFAPLIVGRSPFELAAILHSLDLALHQSLYAKAPISDALYDLVGRALDLPVYQLLGGKCRGEIPLCAPIPLFADVRQTLEEAQRFHDAGYRAFLIKIGIDPRADLANVRGVRERFGDDVCVRVDANAALSFDAALKLLKQLEPFDLDAAEQPIAMWDLEGMAELARRISIPIMADESVATDNDLINVIRHRAATVVHTKQSKNGGIYRIRRLWAIAEAAGMRIYPGNHPCLSVATAASAHLAAAWPGPILEGPFAMGVTGEIAGDIVAAPLRPRGNLLQVPEGPGLGVTIDEDQVARWRVDR